MGSPCALALDRLDGGWHFLSTCYNEAMASADTILHELFDPIGRCLTQEVAKQLMELRAPPSVQARIEELASKNTEGQLSKEERDEYEALVSGGHFIAILQSKARVLLNQASPPA